MILNIYNISPALLSYNGIPQNHITAKIPIKLSTLDDVHFEEPYTDGSVVMWDENTGMFILGSVGMGPGGSSIPGSPGDTIRYGMDTGEGWLATSNLYNDGINIGINTLFPEDILHVAGNIILEEQLRIKTSYEPMILDTDEVKVYLTSGQYIGPGYFDKYVKLCNKGENGEEIIISSYLI